MGFCKYCKKPIIDEHDMCNPDGNGNGYHNECFVEMQIIMRNKAIYDKGKNDVLDKIRAEIEQVSFTHYFEYGEYLGEDTRQERIVNFDSVMQIIDKYKAESEGEDDKRAER